MRKILSVCLLALGLTARATTCPTITAGPIQTADVTFTFTNGSAVLTGTNTYQAGQPLQIMTTGSVATNFAVLTTYYVISSGLSGSQWEMSATLGGSAITAGSAGSGAQTAVIVGLWPSTATANMGDVVQMSFNTPSENYVDDDEAANSTVTFTSPGSTYSVIAGMFLLNAHINGINTAAVRWSAGNTGSTGYTAGHPWVSGSWTWSMNYADHSSLYSCTATGSITVSSTQDSADGFLRQVGSTPNLKTDANGQLFFTSGTGGLFSYYNPSVPNDPYATSVVPARALVTVSGTTVNVVGGTPFTSQTIPSGVYVGLYIYSTSAGTLGTATLYPNVTLNSSTQASLLAPASYSGTVAADLEFFRTGANRPLSNPATLLQSATWQARGGTTFIRYADTQAGLAENTSGWQSSGYNDYNWNTTAAFYTSWGLPWIDIYFAAMHAAGIHTMYGGPNQDNYPTTNYWPCTGSSYTCTGNQQTNLQNLCGMIGARYAAFYDYFEAMNEGGEGGEVPQAFFDACAIVLKTGVSGIAGGNPADPYGHLITQSNSPASYTPAWGPFSGGPADAYITGVSLAHDDNLWNNATVFTYMASSNIITNHCPASTGYGGTTLPRTNDEAPWPVGLAPSSQTPSVPNLEHNGPRILLEQGLLNECGTNTFGGSSDQVTINTGTPTTSTSTWYDFAAPAALFQNFLAGLDTAAAPITVTLGGGFSTNAGAYAAMGSSNHIRLALNSATGSSTTGIPNTVTAGTVTLSIPQASMQLKWWDPTTGLQIGSTVTTSGTSGSQTFTAPTFTYDVWMSVDPAASTNKSSFFQVW